MKFIYYNQNHNWDLTDVINQMTKQKWNAAASLPLGEVKKCCYAYIPSIVACQPIEVVRDTSYYHTGPAGDQINTTWWNIKWKIIKFVTMTFGKKMSVAYEICKLIYCVVLWLYDYFVWDRVINIPISSSVGTLAHQHRKIRFNTFYGR